MGPCPWDFPGMNTGVGCLSLLQGIFPIQELNQGLLHCRWILFQLNYQGIPWAYSIQFSSDTQSCLTLCNPMNHSTPGFPVHHQLPELAQTHGHKVSDAIQTSHPQSPPLSSCLQSFPASGSFPMSVLRIRWPKYWSFSFNISPSNEHPGLISFRMDWLDLPAVQGTLSRIFSNTTVQKHQFFGAQLSSQSNSHIHT